MAKYHRHLQHIGMQTDFEVKENNLFERQNYRSKVQHIKNIKLDPYELIIKKTKNLLEKLCE